MGVPQPDTFQCFYVLHIGVGNVFPPVNKGRRVVNTVKKVFNKSGKNTFIKRGFKGVLDDRLCLLFIHTYSFKQFVFCI